jgi:hypothetical protein
LVTQDTVLHGTQVYSREDELTEAEAATASAYYRRWTGPGDAFYKVRKKAISPQHFKNSTDIGTITVRYVVLGVAPDRTHLRIDAVFVEAGSKRVHVLDTNVETSEFAEIQSHIVRIRREERQAAYALQRQQLQLAAQSNGKGRDAEAAKLKDAESSVQSLELRLHELQNTAELRVKTQANLKSARFQHAATLQSVPANSDVLIEILDPGEWSSNKSAVVEDFRSAPRQPAQPATPALSSSESLESLQVQRAEVEVRAKELSADIKNFEEILNNQVRPPDLATAIKTGTHIFSKPTDASPVLFSADAEDEFQFLQLEGAWVHVQISGSCRVWIRRSQLDLPAEFADTPQPVFALNTRKSSTVPTMIGGSRRWTQ